MIFILHILILCKYYTESKNAKSVDLLASKNITLLNKVVNLIAAREGSCCDDAEKPVKRVRAVRHCGCCGEKGHNSHTYTAEIKDIDNSNTSK